MKKLIVSMKSPGAMLENFVRLAEQTQRGKKTTSHFEISFESKKKFDKFVKNMYVLMAIANEKPQSVYELARILNKDLSNVKKIVTFFEENGVIKIKKRKVDGRVRKTPIVDYWKIEFDLRAA